jgi:taurine dioxygenase
MTIEPLSPTIGAEVGGIHLGGEIDESTLAALRSALLEYKVIFFRDQDISTQQHLEFARLFGELEEHPFAPHKPGHPEVMAITHDRDHPGRENAWHSDVTWREKPSLGSVLRAIEVPAVGGDTLFADMYAAYENLDEKTREAVDGRTAIHDYSRVFGRGVDRKRQAVGIERLPSEEEDRSLRTQFPPMEHPVIRTHPETGRKSIYVNVAFTECIVGLEREESDRLLKALFRESSRPEIQCRFRWRRNSVAFWDNRACQHYAVSDYWPHRRVMERVTIIGDRPV